MIKNQNPVLNEKILEFYDKNQYQISKLFRILAVKKKRKKWLAISLVLLPFGKFESGVSQLFESEDKRWRHLTTHVFPIKVVVPQGREMALAYKSHL